MKEDRREWKPIAIVAGGVWVLSVFFGIVAGNPAGIILLRSVFSGGAAAGVTFAALFILKKFVPGLASAGLGGPGLGGPGLGEQPLDEQPEGDHAVDIVVPEENPHLSVTEEVGERDLDVDGAEEVVEVAGETTLADEPDAQIDEEGAVEDVEELEESDAGDVEMIDDDLPGMDGAEQSFSATQPAVLGAVGPGTVDGGGQEEDVEVVAKAVRTMMQRDQRG